MRTASFLRVVPSLLLTIACASPAPAYLLEPSLWPKGSQIVIQLGFGTTAISLQDGMASWNASAADALDIWNGYLDFISASPILSATVPQASGDGINSAFFSSTLFGDSFEEGTLAVTVILSVQNDATLTDEADVVVNNAFRFDSYRGPLQTYAGDFHRIMVHEFGHVLGLDHVTKDPPGQAIMEPVISDLDHPAFDDTLGIERTYGATIYNVPAQILLRTGDSFQFSITELAPTNDPTSYTITGLPPGLTYDAETGLISGTASSTISSRYGSVLTAHGPFADAYSGAPFYVQGLDRVRGLQRIIKVAGYSMVADPIRPRIYAAGHDDINMIDTDSFAVTQLSKSAGNGLATPNLSISADSSLLLFTDTTQNPPMLNRVDLESLAVLPSLAIPANSSRVLEGLENRDYVSDLSGVFQFDRMTGETQTFIAPTGDTHLVDAPEIALSPDGATLFVTAYPVFQDRLLLTYDVSGPDPVLVTSMPGDFRHPIPSPDGKYLYYILGDIGGSGQLFQAPLPDLTPATAFAATNVDSQIAIGPAGTIYEAVPLDNPAFSTFSLYDPASLQQTFNVDLDHFDLEPFAFFFAPGSAVFDSSGKYLFVSTISLEPEVWAFSTDLGSFPVPVADPNQNLLNISTRARVEAGESAMIGGFIIAGEIAKKVLIRGVGPSLSITGALSNPVLDLYDSSGQVIASNDNWISDRLNVVATAIPPASERESAIITTLAPGSYTAVLGDLTGQPGLGLVEIYDLNPNSSVVANISTRGKVETGDNVMIGGFIIGGANNTRILIRAIGPSLAAQGILGPLADPILELHDEDGRIVSTNDDWRSSQQDEIIATGIPPSNDKESAIVTTLYSGSYTAIVRGQDNTTGVALIEVYNLDSAGSP